MKWTCPRCERLIHGRTAEHCTECHETFASTTAGDAHRIGSFMNDADPRRCRAPGELFALGLWRDAHDQWHGEARLDGQARRRPDGPLDGPRGDHTGTNRPDPVPTTGEPQ